MSNKIIYVAIISASIIISGAAAFLLVPHNNSPQPMFGAQENSTAQPASFTLKKFNSTDELQKFLIDSQVKQNTQYSMEQQLGLARSSLAVPVAPVPLGLPVHGGVAIPATTESAVSNGGPQYSTTNVQVAGIDEPDFIKNDGKYAYILTQDKLTVIDAYPGEAAKILSKVGLDVNGNYLQNMFLNKDRLVVFYNDNRQQYSINQYDYMPNPVYVPVTHAVIIDVSDRQNPRLLNNYEVTGSYIGARMIGDNVYLISNSYVDYVHPMMPVMRGISGGQITSDVYYFGNPEQNYNFDTITTFGVYSGTVSSKTFLMGATGTIYVSDDTIYLTYQKYQPYYADSNYNKDRFFKVIVTLLPADLQSQINSIESGNLDASQKWAQISDLMQNTYNKMSDADKTRLFDLIQQAVVQYDITKQQDYRKTVIQKFAIDNGTISYTGEGEVPGYLLNQYSMDENNNRFRVATTSEYYSSKGITTSNNVYVLDQTLHIVGSLEKIAPDESIYSARFMGDKLYLVTYQRIDPFFVIDLSSDAPKVLGALKIPGYSSYLHPYDGTHVIGIGKETKQNQYGGLQPIGVKVSLFDVSNVTNPITVDTYLIGGQGTDSEVLSDPKALLFDKEKNILSIPVFQQYYGGPLPLDDSSSKDSSVGIMPPRPIQPNNWKGFYVFGVDPAKGFTLKGTIDHTITSPNYGYGSRSFYIGNDLYTVTPGLLKINNMTDIKNEISTIHLDYTGQVIKYMK
jgi:uncharacterized secreted protein with C-terminal beta-propeller domain